MKKFFALALVLVMVFALAACGDKGSTTPSGSSDNSSNSGSAATPTASNTPDSSNSEGNTPTTDNIPSKSDDKWPDNEWTQQIPKPPFTTEGAIDIGRDFNIGFADATNDTVKAYIDELTASGFVSENGITTTDDGIAWFGTNADGWRVSVTSMNGGTMLITKPE